MSDREVLSECAGWQGPGHSDTGEMGGGRKDYLEIQVELEVVQWVTLVHSFRLERYLSGGAGMGSIYS